MHSLPEASATLLPNMGIFGAELRHFKNGLENYSDSILRVNVSIKVLDWPPF